MKLHTRITITFILPTVVGIALASFLISQQIKGYLDRHQTADLRTSVEVLSIELTEGSLRFDLSGASDAHLGRLARTAGARLTLVGKDGVVLYDSEVPRDSLFTVENHGTRREILEAKAGRTGIDRRMSHTRTEEFVYAAHMVLAPGLGVLDSGFVRLARTGADIDAVDAGVQRVVWAIGLLTIVGILIISRIMSHQITAPINDIVTTAQAITAGDVHERVSIRSGDEIAALGKAINDMAEKLGNDIEVLRKLERVRSEFLGNVSHELRTPIFSVQGFIETLLDGAVDDPQVNRDFLEKAHHHVVRLNTLLSDLIEISRIESGEMKMSFRYFPVIDFLRQVTDEMRPMADKEGLRLSVRDEVPPGEVVYGDRDRLKQVLVNLVDNAIKYTEKGGEVTIGARREGERVVVSVADTGTGIAQEHLPRIFERFYRVDRDRSREVGGTGLGLAIVKHIVEAHGSSVAVESEPGKGSMFSFGLKR